MAAGGRRPHWQVPSEVAMKRSILFAAAVVPLVVAGCASNSARVTNRYDEEVDTGKVVAVNQWAQMKGARVMWINYPQKPKNLESGTVN